MRGVGYTGEKYGSSPSFSPVCVKPATGNELLAARLALRPDRERPAASRLQAAYGDEYKALTLYDSKLDIRDMLGEQAQQRMQKTVPQRQLQRKYRDIER